MDNYNGFCIKHNIPIKLIDIVAYGIAKKTEITFSNTFKSDTQTPNTQKPYDILPYVAIQKFVDFGNVNTNDDNIFKLIGGIKNR